MALSVIFVLYAGIGVMAVAGSVWISRRYFSPKAEQVCYAIFLIAIAGFYLAFTGYFGNDDAWRFEVGGVMAFAALGLVGMRMPIVLMIGYFLHGLWDLLHEVPAHGGPNLFASQPVTEIPLAYGAFCAAYDWCIAAYFYTRRQAWRDAWRAHDWPEKMP